ncbi:MAG: EAL domain-containing protein [Gammaproteobacteria bacterium]|nr:EAL domain-containing protein [Gammaproteobacteria bacterium]
MFVLLVIYSLSGYLTDVKQSAITVSNEHTSIAYKALEDPLHQFSPQIAHENFLEKPYQPLNSTLIGLSDSVYWYEIKLENYMGKTRALAVLVDNPMIDQIEVYSVEDNYKLIAQLGDKRISNSPELMAFPSVNVTLKSGESKTLFFRSQSTGPQAAFFAIYETPDFEQHKAIVYIIMGCFIGSVILMCLYNVILYLGSKEKLYLLYVGYISAFCIALSAVHGFLGYIVPSALIDFFASNIISLNFAVASFALLFGLNFLGFEQERDRLVTRVATQVSKVLLICAAVSILVPEKLSAPIFFIGQMCMYFFVLYFVYVKSRERTRWVNFYLVSWLPLFIGAAVAPLLLFGAIEYSMLANFALILGVIFEMTFISMGLAERIRTYEKERLYQATHDNVFGFANISLLNDSFKYLTDVLHPVKFSLVVVRINKYAPIVPYVPANKLKTLIHQFVNDIQQHFSEQVELHPINPGSSFEYVMMVRDGVFGFLVTNTDQNVLNRAIKNFAQRQPMTYLVDKLSINFNCCISAVPHQKHITSTNDLVTNALQEIEVALSNGRNYGMFNAESHLSVQRKVQLASDLNSAIETNQFYLAHQPQVDLSTNQVVGSEVLIRWQHKEFGFVSPEEFIKIAEQTGMINKISKWVFDTSCKHLTKMIDLGYTEHKISVNISVHDVLDDNFIWYLMSTINDNKLSADKFILELTETAFVDDMPKFRTNILHLKELGFGLAIDDFGTGYSSLIYVSKHPFDEIKIDREFVFFLTQSETDEAIVSTTITMAKNLGIKVVAEGIENQETGDMLKKMGCDIVQGYHYSKPLKFEEFIDWVSAEYKSA